MKNQRNRHHRGLEAFLPILHDDDIIRPSSNSRRKPQRNGYRNERGMKRHAATILAVAAVAAYFTGFAQTAKDKSSEAFSSFCNEKSFCSQQARINAPLEPIATNAKFPSAKNPSKKVSNMAEFIIDPRLIKRDSKSKAIGIGVSVHFDKQKFAEVSRDNPAKVNVGNYIAFMAMSKSDTLKEACTEDLDDIVKAAQSRADMLLPAGSKVSADQLRAAESDYAVAPYTTDKDNPNVPNIYVYYVANGPPKVGYEVQCLPKK